VSDQRIPDDDEEDENAEPHAGSPEARLAQIEEILRGIESHTWEEGVAAALEACDE